MMRNILLNLAALGFVAFAAVECGCAAQSSLSAIATPRPRIEAVVVDEGGQSADEIAACLRQLEGVRAARRDCVSAGSARCSDEKQVAAADRQGCMRGVLAECNERQDQAARALACRAATRYATR